MGDFNLDARMESRPDYDRKIPLNIPTNFAPKKIKKIGYWSALQGDN